MYLPAPAAHPLQQAENEALRKLLLDLAADKEVARSKLNEVAEVTIPSAETPSAGVPLILCIPMFSSTISSTGLWAPTLALPLLW
jgi:hypothetical protein